MQRSDGQINFPPLVEECSNFLSVGVPNAQMSALEKLKSSATNKQLIAIRETLSKNLQEKPKKLKLPEVVTKKDRNMALWLKHKIQKKTFLTFQKKQSIYLKLFNITNQILGVLDICNCNSITCSCNISLFQKYMNDSLHSHFFQTTEKHIKYLKRKLYEINTPSVDVPDSERNKIISLLFLRFQNSVNSSLSYAEPTLFDQSFARVFEIDDKIDFQKLLILFGKKSLTYFNKLVNDLLKKHSNGNNKKHRIMLRCALIRYVFNRS